MAVLDSYTMMRSPHYTYAAMMRTQHPIPAFPSGQFRDCTIGECPVSQALENGQLLAAHTEALVHLYETNVVTNGEMVVEVTNNQLGMGNLHSVHPCAGAIMAAVLACVNDQGELVQYLTCNQCVQRASQVWSTVLLLIAHDIIVRLATVTRAPSWSTTDSIQLRIRPARYSRTHGIDGRFILPENGLTDS